MDLALQKITLEAEARCVCIRKRCQGDQGVMPSGWVEIGLGWTWEVVMLHLFSFLKGFFVQDEALWSVQTFPRLRNIQEIVEIGP